MNKTESLAILNSVYKQMESMTESQLFDYMMNNSPTFRNHIDELQNTIEISLDLDDCSKDIISSAESESVSSKFMESKASNIKNHEDDSWLQAA